MSRARDLLVCRDVCEIEQEGKNPSGQMSRGYTEYEGFYLYPLYPL